MTRRTAVAVTCVTALVSLVITACGGSATTTVPASPGQTTSSPRTEAPISHDHSSGQSEVRRLVNHLRE